MSEKSIVILSGGCDSTTLLYDVLNQGHDVTAISFAYGQKHIRELECAEATCKKLNVPWVKRGLYLGNNSALTSSKIDVPEGHYEDDNMKQTVVPFRNLALLVEAAIFANSIGAKKIFYGAHSGDFAQYPDTRPEFVDAAREVIKLGDYAEIDVQAPYLHISKRDIVKKGLDLKVDYSLTHTCYNGKSKPCGRCGSCIERIESFYANDARDPLYAENEWKNAVEHMKEVVNK